MTDYFLEKSIVHIISYLTAMVRHYKKKDNVKINENKN